MPYVNDSAFPDAQNEYVCWIDIMGTKRQMEHSVNTCGIFMTKFHAAILEAVQEKGFTKDRAIETYPVMDGVYITSKTRKNLEIALVHIFSGLGRLFNSTTDFHHQFLVKAAIAYGPVIHGEDIGDVVNRAIANNPSYKNSLLIGLPMIQAITGEQNAPPFGVFIHESARTFHPKDEEAFSFKWWKWFLYDKTTWSQKQTQELRKAIMAYFKSCKEQSLVLDYPVERIAIHQEATKEYFANIS
ncbi:Uncharacterised protein [Faecalibacterium prausnitzii]|nr:Uncharacterised protein [Faecalibacterium prausnitzii]